MDVTYSSYLKIPELLALQQEPRAHDELLFVVLHQSHELWFKLALHELDEATRLIDADRFPEAETRLRRIVTIMRQLVAQWDVLGTMTPAGYLEFRHVLEGGSGFQSVQFRELEFLSGAKDEGYVHRFKGLTDHERESLRRRLEEPSLWDAFTELLAARGLDTSSDEALTASLREVAHDRPTHGDLWAMAEALILHDELAAAWRARHVVMVERMIGSKTGTGGSTGSTYLRSRLEMKYYPLLWNLRSAL
jgi:tryptophan 2,3-dioxygenase